MDVLIPPVDQIVGRPEVLMGILEAEILAHCEKQIIRNKMLFLMKDPVVEDLGSLWGIVSVQLLVDYERWVNRLVIEVEPDRRVIVIV